MITACNALSMRRRRSSSEGKNDPTRSFGDLDLDVPGGGRDRLGSVPVAVGAAVRTVGRPAPIFSVASASINACSPARSTRNLSRCLSPGVLAAVVWSSGSGGLGGLMAAVSGRSMILGALPRLKRSRWHARASVSTRRRWVSFSWPGRRTRRRGAQADPAVPALVAARR